jgi:hypothetical protein
MGWDATFEHGRIDLPTLQVNSDEDRDWCSAPARFDQLSILRDVFMLCWSLVQRFHATM